MGDEVNVDVQGSWRTVLVGMALSGAQVPVLAGPVASEALIWSLQFEEATRAASMTTTAATLERRFDSPVGQDLRGRASLATGEVGTRVDSVGRRSGQALVAMFDTLQFSTPGNGPVTVSYTARYDGELYKPDVFGNAYAVYQVTIYDITGLVSWIESSSFSGLFDTYAPSAQARQLADTRFDDLVALGGVQQVDVAEEGRFQAMPGRRYGIRIVSNSFASGGSRSDFYGTGSFRFTDLGGATFTSGSGSFLSTVGGTVNEPALPVLAGLLAALLAGRRQRAGRRSA